MIRPWSLARLAAVALVLAVAGWVSVARAQDVSPEGREIKRLDIDAPPSADIARVRDTIRVREGDLYSRAAIQADIAALYALGEFADVRVETSPLEEGLRVVYALRPRPRVRAVRFEGHPEMADSKLLDEIRTRVDAVASPYALKNDLEMLRGHYRDEGYLFAEILQEVHTEGDVVDVVYTIHAGPRFTIESVQFEGNDAIPGDELRKLITSVRRSGLFGRGRYDPALLRADLLAVRERFRRKGYLDATVGHELITDDAKERAWLIVRVRQGELYRVNRLVIRGTEVLAAEQVLGAMSLREGHPFAMEQIERDLEAVRGLYGRRGHIRAEVSMERTVDEREPLVTVRLTIDEGPKVFVNRVLIRGNRRTQDHVVRREVTLVPGQVADASEIEETRRRLANTGLFYSTKPGAAEEPIRVRFADTADPTLADLVVEVTEGGLGEFAIGAAYSSEIGLAANLRLTYRNFDALDFPSSWRDLFRGNAFTGGGQKLTISVSPGTHYDDYRLSWLNPSVWDSPYSAGFDLYLHEFAWNQYYDDRRAGGSITVGRRFWHDLEVSLTPRVEQVKISNVDSGAPPDAQAVRGTHQRHSVQLKAVYDRRDNIFLTTRGYRLGGSVEMGGTALGGDVDFLREVFEVRGWWTVWDQEGWGKHVVTLGTEVGFLQSTRGGDVPIFDRFFIGGLGSMRGFEFRRVGPVDPGAQRHIGGEFKFLANAEYEAPLYRNILRGVLFVDTGTLEDSAGDFSSLRAAVGAGLRVRVPFLGAQQVPLSFYIAQPIAKERRDKREALSFTIGTGFEF